MGDESLRWGSFVIRHGFMRALFKGVIVLGAIGIGIAQAQGVSCQDPMVASGIESELCDLGPVFGGTTSIGQAVSGNGSLVGGHGMVGGSYHAFVWTEHDGYRKVSPVFGSNVTESKAFDISGNGKILVGQVVLDADTANLDEGEDTQRAFKWDWESGEFKTLKSPNSLANAVSDDGSVVVGSFDSEDGLFTAFRWSDEEATPLPLPSATTSLTFSAANDVNADGSVVVGYVNEFSTIGSQAVPVRWDGAADGRFQVTKLAELSGSTNSVANAVNDTGDVVVGFSETMSVENAVKWQEGNIAILDGLDSSYDSQALDVNADGSVVVGFGGSPDGRRAALVWRDDGDQLSLGTLQGHNTSEALAVNDDGSIVVGTSCKAEPGLSCNNSGDPRAFIWRQLPSGDNQIVDPANTISLGQLSLMDRQAVTSVIERSVLAFSIKELMFDAQQGSSPTTSISTQSRAAALSPGLPTKMRVDVGSTGASAKRVTTFGSASLATNIGSGLTFGGGIGFGNIDSRFGTSAYEGRFWKANIYLRKRPLRGRGLTWKIGAGYAEYDLNITRYASLPDTELGVGQAMTRTKALFAEVGYETYINPAIKITPYIGLSRLVSKSDSYSEAGTITLPMSYGQYKTDRTRATIGMVLNRRLSNQTNLDLDFGLVTDVYQSKPLLVGRSPTINFSTVASDTPNKTRIFASAKLERVLNSDRKIEFGITARQSGYTNDVSIAGNIGYVANF